MLLTKLGEDGEGEAAASKLESKTFKEVFSYGHAVPRTLYFTYCMTTSV
jgi:hypothetical protein